MSAENKMFRLINCQINPAQTIPTLVDDENVICDR